MTPALVIDTVSHGYLASNQLTRVLNALPAQLEATVVTTLSTEKRKFSWLWHEGKNRALLVNRITGTLFDPVSGRALASAPTLAEAPIEVPELEIGGDLPVGVYSTAEK